MEVLPCRSMKTLSREIGAKRCFTAGTKSVSINCDIAFAFVAIAQSLDGPDDLPLMPAVTAAVSVPTRLSDRASLAHLRAVAHAAAREALSDADT